jgi:hypothetical protein
MLPTPKEIGQAGLIGAKRRGKTNLNVSKIYPLSVSLSIVIYSCLVYPSITLRIR